MKKRTKEILSALLAASILLSMPAGMRAAEAAGQEWTDRGRITGVQTRPQSDDSGGEVGDRETEEIKETASQMQSEESSEALSSDISEKISEEPPEESSEGVFQSISEEQSEESSEDTSKIESISGTEDQPETKPQLKTESETASEYRPELMSETDIKLFSSELAETELDPKEEWAALPAMMSLCDSDFYIEFSKDGQTRQYGYTEWLCYLDSCKGWVNGTVEVKLSDTGKKCFDTIQVKEQEDEAERGKKQFTFWAENSGKNASTLTAENGTRFYTAGVDTEAPVLEAFSTDSECYGPTRTDTEQYFAEDLVFKGSFRDDISGVSRIEYTADIRPEEDTVWTEVENVQRLTDSAAGFQIVFSDGCYPAVAVRAIDGAGNVSAVTPYTNDAGEYIKAAVDSAAPVLKFDVSAGGQDYSGEDDSWTNQDVQIRIMPECSYAGIGQCEYAYVKIGENMTDVSEKWAELTVQDDSLAELEITEDTNGFYLFRAVSKSGVGTTEDAALRIRIQHQAAGIKPILVSGADETKCKNGWYNKQSGTPEICFEYPDYDTGALSKEYDAPVTIHYQLAKQDFVPDTLGDEVPEEAYGTEKTAVIGVMSDKDFEIKTDGTKEFVVTRDDLKQHVVDFGDNDGFYTLKYWMTDRAGNESEKQIYQYKVDCHEPTGLTMELDGSVLEVGKEAKITYQRFYSGTVSGSADADYGISQKGSLVIEKAKKIGEWKDVDGGHAGNQDTVSISPNTRCFLYIRAEDAAGNAAEGWTNGIVVDNMAPGGAGGSSQELIVAPGGANEHGFFNRDVTVDIRIKDEPGDGNCAALQLVTCSVGRDGTDTIAGQELFSFTKEAPDEAEIIAASDFQGTQMIDARANESNEAYIEVTAADRSGNTKTSTQLLKIDVTRPEIDIRFDNNDAVNGMYYNSGRTATVHVHELNFNPDAVRVSVVKDGQVSEAALSGWTGDGMDHYATFALAEDGEYSITACCTDLADNASDEIQPETFVIDCTAPKMTVELTAGREVQPAEKVYFNTGVEAVITVTERNFRAEDFVVNMTPVSDKGTWIHEGDIHTLRIPLAEDGVYHIDCACMDMAGNSADTVERDFIIDKTAPVVAIDGVRDGSANSGAVLPVIFVQDANIERPDISVSVRTGAGDRVNTAVVSELVSDEGRAGYRLTLTDMTEKADNVYYLSVSAFDLAGNKTERTCRFSLNRTGSVYDLTSLTHLMERQYNTYRNLGDIEIVEMNIDTVEEFELYISRNGELGYEAEYTREMSGSVDIGYTYTYHIDRENFAREGIYRLTLYSRDKAGNEVNSASELHGREITFIVDNTAPRVVIEGVEPGGIYDVEQQPVQVMVTDNFRLAEAEFTLVNGADEVLARWDYMALAGENEPLELLIPQHDGWLSLLYRVKDAAGNETQTFPGDQAAQSGFLVTTDKYIQLVNSPSRVSAGKFVFFVTGVSGAAVFIGVTAAACRRKRIRK